MARNEPELLILPNIAALSTAQGRSPLATYETSLFDEDGDEQPDFGLADLFGAHFERRMPGPMKNSYLRLERERPPGPPSLGGDVHPLLAGFDETERIIV